MVRYLKKYKWFLCIEALILLFSVSYIREKNTQFKVVLMCDNLMECYLVKSQYEKSAFGLKEA